MCFVIIKHIHKFTKKNFPIKKVSSSKVGVHRKYLLNVRKENIS